MSQHATINPPTRHTPLRLADEPVTPVQAEPLPRWSKILDARDDISAGLYDDPAVFSARLDACLDRLLADVS